MSNFSVFKDNILGQGVEVSSKEASFQCMDLAYLWVFCHFVPKISIQHACAYQVYKMPNYVTKYYFDIIPNTATFVPETGDLGVFDATKENPAGHICVCTGEGDTNGFRSLDQNYGGSYVRFVWHDYKNFFGVLRLKDEYKRV